MNGTLRLGLLLFGCLSMGSAWACSLKPLHQQFAVLGAFSTEAQRLPQEVSVRAGDLVSVLMPQTALVHVQDASSQETNAVVALDADRYQALSRRQGGRPPAEVRAGVYPSHLAWRHFGASQPGVAYVKLTAGQAHALLRVSIADRLVRQQGMNLVWSDARQQDTITLTPDDTLTFKLPGAPGDGWAVDTQNRPVAVSSIALPGPDDDTASGHVLLRVNTAALLSGGVKRTVTITRAGRDTYHFTVRPRSTPAC